MRSVSLYLCGGFWPALPLPLKLYAVVWLLAGLE